MVELKKYLLNNIFTIDGNKLSTLKIKKIPTNILQSLVSFTSFLPININVSLRIFTFLNGQTSLSKCICCNNEIIPTRRSSQIYCSYRCATIATIEKRKHTCIIKYGVDNPAKNLNVKQKCTDTCFSKYGVSHASKLDEVKSKTKITTLSKYGDTSIRRTKHYAEKYKNTCFTKYGVENVFQSDVIKSQIANTNISKYGNRNYAQSYEYKNNHRLLSLSKLSDYVKDNLTIVDFTNTSTETTFKCNNCDFIFSILLPHIRYQSLKCPNCNRGSIIENKIKFILNEHDIKYIVNDRSIISPYELDFYLPDYNIAIECHGLYWHSEQLLKNKLIEPSNYHLLKHDLCNDKGIQLLQFFEDEINNKAEIVKNIILAKCNKLKKLCDARECEINAIIDNKIINNFIK